MPEDIVYKYCPLIKDRCRTDCMFLMLITKGNYECALVHHLKDISLAVGGIDSQLENLTDPTYIKFIKGE